MSKRSTFWNVCYRRHVTSGHVYWHCGSNSVIKRSDTAPSEAASRPHVAFVMTRRENQRDTTWTCGITRTRKSQTNSSKSDKEMICIILDIWSTDDACRAYQVTKLDGQKVKQMDESPLENNAYQATKDERERYNELWTLINNTDGFTQESKKMNIIWTCEQTFKRNTN